MKYFILKMQIFLKIFFINFAYCGNTVIVVDVLLLLLLLLEIVFDSEFIMCITVNIIIDNISNSYK